MLLTAWKDWDLLAKTASPFQFRFFICMVWLQLFSQELWLEHQLTCKKELIYFDIWRKKKNLCLMLLSWYLLYVKLYWRVENFRELTNWLWWLVMASGKIHLQNMNPVLAVWCNCTAVKKRGRSPPRIRTLQRKCVPKLLAYPCPVYKSQAGLPNFENRMGECTLGVKISSASIWV